MTRWAIAANCVLFILCVTAGVRLVRGLHGVEGEIFALQGAPPPPAVGEIFPIAGITASGRPFGQGLPLGTRFVAAFVLRGKTLPDDVSFWSSARALTSAHGIQFIGYCDGARCRHWFEVHRQPEAFPVLSYGQVTGLEYLYEADRHGLMVVADNRVRIVALPAWRGGRPSGIAAYLDGLK